MAERLFGTDGVRGRAGEGWLAPGPASALGRAAGLVLRGERVGPLRALVGHDGRHSGPGLEAAVASGLAHSGFAVRSAGLITTPGLALLARLGEYDAAAMISASHNPAADNGIKLFGDRAAKLDDATEDRIEACARADAAPLPATAAPAMDPGLETCYLNALLASAKGLALDGLSIVLDCANGGASRVAPRVFARLGAKVAAVAAEPDGDNINDGCGATHLALAESEVRRRGADLGIALDGDGDRCMLIDERGQVVNGDGILALVARHMAARGELVPPKVVATVMSNKGLQRALREARIELVTVDVGDRRVVEGLKRVGARLGGEQSGHIVFGADHHYIGDGIYTALRVLAVLRAAKRPLSELAGVYRPFPQVLLNVPVGRKPPLRDQPGVSEAVRAAEGELGDDGRVLLRYSGTELLARVMVEGPDAARSEALARRIATAVAASIGA